MIKVNLPSEKEFNFALKGIEERIIKGEISREEGYKKIKELKKRFGSGQAQREAYKAISDAKYMTL